MTWTPIISLIAGAMGWFGLKFLFEPLRDIWDLRTELQELLVLYGNLPADADGELRTEAGRGFRRVGAKLAASHLSAWWWVRSIYEHPRGLNLDVYSAGEASMGLGKEIIELNYSVPNAGSLVPAIRSYLRLPPMGPTKAYQRLMVESGRPAPFDSGDMRDSY